MKVAVIGSRGLSVSDLGRYLPENTTEIDNDKYAFRCFLLRLGFIGSEYKTERKILLRNLTGSSAFRNGGAANEVSE